MQNIEVEIQKKILAQPNYMHIMHLCHIFDIGHWGSIVLNTKVINLHFALCKRKGKRKSDGTPQNALLVQHTLFLCPHFGDVSSML